MHQATEVPPFNHRLTYDVSSVATENLSHDSKIQRKHAYLPSTATNPTTGGWGVCVCGGGGSFSMLLRTANRNSKVCHRQHDCARNTDAVTATATINKKTKTPTIRFICNTVIPRARIVASGLPVRKPLPLQFFPARGSEACYIIDIACCHVTMGWKLECTIKFKAN